MRVIHAAHRGTVAFLARNMETDEEAVIITESVHKDWQNGGREVYVGAHGSGRTPP